jgi:hypothetical protein
MGDLKKNRTRQQTFTDAHDAAVRILNEKPILVSIGFNRKKMGRRQIGLAVQRIGFGGPGLLIDPALAASAALRISCRSAPSSKAVRAVCAAFNLSSSATS